MRDDLLAYLLNDLDEEQRRRIEQRLEVDPIWQHELERLRAYVESAHQASDSPDDSLPENLVNRTCSFVKQASSQGALSPAVLPASLTESQDLVAVKTNRWTLIDFAVVASI
ncbi:MAG: anti-sigma factor family protein, partial [Bythopirellula sp.]